MDKEEAIKILKDFHDKSALFSVRTALETLHPELKESEDEKVRKALISILKSDFEKDTTINDISVGDIITWLEKQGEQKPTQEIKPFEAEHGKYYYCIKDYFCGGRKQASKGDVVQALRGLPIMGLKDASEYFLPVNFIKCNSAWSEEDEEMCQETIDWFEKKCFPYALENDNPARESIKWLKSLKGRVQPKQEWSKEDKKMFKSLKTLLNDASCYSCTEGIDKILSWIKSLRPQPKQEWSEDDETG